MLELGFWREGYQRQKKQTLVLCSLIEERQSVLTLRNLGDDIRALEPGSGVIVGQMAALLQRYERRSKLFQLGTKAA